ncbi:zf-HC2 domain-containing protein, partial [Spirochaetota bacterium]
MADEYNSTADRELWNKFSSLSEKRKTSECISFEMMASFVDGKASKKETKKVEEHISACSACRDALTHMNEMQDLKAFNVPEGIKREVKDLVSEATRRRVSAADERIEQVREQIRRLFSVTVFRPALAFGSIAAVFFISVSVLFNLFIADTSLINLKFVLRECRNETKISRAQGLSITVEDTIAREVSKLHSDTASLMNLGFINRLVRRGKRDEQLIDVRIITAYEISRQTEKKHALYRIMDTLSVSPNTVRNVLFSMNTLIDTVYAKTKKSESKILMKAYNLYKEGNIKKARALCRKIIKKGKGSMDARIAARLLHYVSSYENLEKEYTGLIEDNEKVVTVKDQQEQYFKLASIRTKMHDYEKASQLYMHASVTDKNTYISQKSSFNSGWCEKMLGDIEKAEERMESIRDSHLVTAAKYEIADIKHQTGEHERAVEILNGIAMRSEKASKRITRKSNERIAMIGSYQAGYSYLYDLDSPERAESLFKRSSDITESRLNRYMQVHMKERVVRMET